MQSLTDKELKKIVEVMRATASLECDTIADKVQRLLWSRSRAISAADRRLIKEAEEAGKVQVCGVFESGLPENATEGDKTRARHKDATAARLKFMSPGSLLAELGL